MIWEFRGLTIVGFKLKDPRVFMSCVLIVYTFIGQTFLSFDHRWDQIILSLVVACALDTLLNYWRSRKIILPLSGVITGLGLGLLVESTSLWPFIVAPVLAIASKSLVRVKGQHIFNPSNFGLVVLLLLFPEGVTTLAAQWSGSLIMVIAIVCVGMFSAYRVSRLDLVLSFIAGFCVMALIKEIVHQTGFAVVYGPLLGAGLQLFMLSMITDPKTTPGTRGMRILFGLSIAVVDGLLRLVNNQYSPFIALFVVCAFFPLGETIVLATRFALAKRSSHNTNDEATQDAHTVGNAVELTK